LKRSAEPVAATRRVNAGAPEQCFPAVKSPASK
jgi:hypothetical protein